MGHLPLGKVLATPGALKLLLEQGEDPFDYLVRHATGDWGELCAFDRLQNEKTLRHEARVLSSYNTAAGKVWIITEVDRSVTTIDTLRAKYGISGNDTVDGGAGSGDVCQRDPGDTVRNCP